MEDVKSILSAIFKEASGHGARGCLLVGQRGHSSIVESAEKVAQYLYLRNNSAMRISSAGLLSAIVLAIQINVAGASSHHELPSLQTNTVHILVAVVKVYRAVPGGLNLHDRFVPNVVSTKSLLCVADV